MPRSSRLRYTPRQIDADGADRALALAHDRGVDTSRSEVQQIVTLAGAAAPGILTALFSRADLPATLADELASRGAIAPAVLAPPDPARATSETEAQVLARLRALRHEALARTALRELFAHADVDRTAREWSRVAGGCVAHALASAERIVEARHDATPVDDSGRRVPFVVLGMGKLGGEELNLGSDIDICYFYGTDEGAAGERTLHEHFSRLGALASEFLDTITADGFAFRVDLRLRPEGNSGAIANSLASAERYYETWGRSWERAALLRARPIAGNVLFGEVLLDAFRPFVFRRTVAPQIAVDLAQMLERSRRELLRDDTRDLKLGSGGIREAEFFVQALQLIWGGRHKSLQVTHTLDALARLRSLGLLSHRDAHAFSDAWALLRRLEHRVQTDTGYATHTLPDDPARTAVLARSLGYPSADALVVALGRARATIRALFASLFPRDAGLDRPATKPPVSSEGLLADRVAAAAPRDELVSLAHDTLGVRDPDGAVDDLLRLSRRADMPLAPVGRDRHPQLGPRLLAEVRDAPDPDLALGHLADLFGRMHGADRYIQALAASPERVRGLVGLLGASETLSKTLLARPDLVDAVLSGSTGAPDVAQIRDRFDTLPFDPDANGDDPLERAIAAMRRARRELVLQIGLADLAGVLTAGEVARRMSALAEALVRAAFRLAAGELAERYGLSAEASTGSDGLAVFALGSLAAHELGYGSDVDLFVVHGDLADTVGGRRRGVGFAEWVARLTQRAMSLLSMPHPEGPGYSVDARLRPSGSQGTLVVSVEAFDRYHFGPPESGPTAASWERQALIRSRFVAGDASTAARSESSIVRAAYESGVDAAELARLRVRMQHELGRERHGSIALKYGKGGLVDVEFAAQALQMAHGRDARLRTPTTRRALATLRELGYLDEAVADTLLGGEKLLRRTLLAARLITEQSTLRPGAPGTATVARKLGFRGAAERTAEESLLAELEHTRERVHAAWERVLEGIG